MRLFITALLLGILAATCATTGGTPQQILEASVSTVAKVRFNAPVGGTTQGTCFPYRFSKEDDKYITFWLTAAHMRRPGGTPNEIHLYHLSNPVAPYEILKDLSLVSAHKFLDALVFTSKTDTPLKVCTLSTTLLKFGDRVVASGFAFGRPLVMSEGIAIRPDTKGTWMCSAPVALGMSGGPIFNEKGHVVGITSTTFIASYMNGFSRVDILVPHIHRFVTISNIAEWLEGIHDAKP